MIADCEIAVYWGLAPKPPHGTLLEKGSMASQNFQKSLVKQLFLKVFEIPKSFFCPACTAKFIWWGAGVKPLHFAIGYVDS